MIKKQRKMFFIQSLGNFVIYALGFTFIFVLVSDMPKPEFLEKWNYGDRIIFSDNDARIFLPIVFSMGILSVIFALTTRCFPKPKTDEDSNKRICQNLGLILIGLLLSVVVFLPVIMAFTLPSVSIKFGSEYAYLYKTKNSNSTAIKVHISNMTTMHCMYSQISR